VKPVRLDKILLLINSIVDEQIKDVSEICMDCLTKKSGEYGMEINIFETDDRNEFVYTISDSESNFTGQPYNFNFAARYDFSECNNAEECFK